MFVYIRYQYALVADFLNLPDFFSAGSKHICLSALLASSDVVDLETTEEDDPDAKQDPINSIEIKNINKV